MSKREDPKAEVLQGTLDLIVLRTLETMGPQHGFGLARRIQQVSEGMLDLNQGTLYPALLRLEQRGWVEGALIEVQHAFRDLDAPREPAAAIVSSVRSTIRSSVSCRTSALGSSRLDIQKEYAATHLDRREKHVWCVEASRNVPDSQTAPKPSATVCASFALGRPSQSQPKIK